MWCPQCRSEVSGAASLDGRRLACATCGTEILAQTPAVKPVRSPQELLSRWAREDALDGVSAARPPKAESRSAPTSRTGPVGREDCQKAIRIRLPIWWPSSGNTSPVGLLLAYGGVGIIALGAIQIVCGLARGQPGSTIYGWIAAIVGHLLVLLGVVTLVTHGLEQAAADLTEKLDRLGERLIRLEGAERGVAGPHWEDAARRAISEASTGHVPQ